VTATSPRKEVSVTVNHGGNLTSINFTGTAYKRLASKDLAALIMRTLDEAREKAADESAELVAPMVPSGVNARDLVSGKLGVEPLMPADGPRVPRAVREYLQRTEH
jgi:YbaB/EbfC DNA-binding family protein